MKKVRLTLSLALIAGLLAIIPASAQIETSKEGSKSGTENLQLLITINRMDLTPTQMQEVRDILAGVLSEADMLKADRDAFTQEMLEFNGSADDLDALLVTFREQVNEKATSLQESAQGVLDEIKGILTIKQGEILRECLMPMRGEAFSTRTQGRTPHEQDVRTGIRGLSEGFNPQTRGELLPRLENRFGGEAQNPMTNWMREFLADHPELREKVMERFNTMNQETQRPVGQRGEQPLQQADKFGVDHTLLAQKLADKQLSTLRQIVDILEAKLQYIR
jgi:hypothetical protein